MKPVKIILKSGKDEAVRRFHPWVFSGAIKKMDGEPEEGSLVEIYSNKDEYLATGHYQKGSIAVRVIAYEPVAPGKEFWKQKLISAYNLRHVIGLTDNPETNVYRLVFAEGDGMPGLIIDYYNGTAVMQCHSVGMYQSRHQIVEALRKIYDDRLKAVYDKSADTLPKHFAENISDSYLFKSEEVSNEVVENGCRFTIDWVEGQKTGFFIDQRENRKLLAKYSKGEKVLNTFSYSGGFSVYALKAGATLVHSVDSSRKAIELAEQNVALNGFDKTKHRSFNADTMKFLASPPETYDIIVLDPPAFAKHFDVRHNAVQGYKRLNARALEKIAPGGVLFTFSCSQVIDSHLFNNTLIAAAIQVGRKVRILHQLSQPADHPVNAFHPEGQYLKGLVLYVE